MGGFGFGIRFWIVGMVNSVGSSLLFVSDCSLRSVHPNRPEFIHPNRHIINSSKSTFHILIQRSNLHNSIQTNPAELRSKHSNTLSFIIQLYNSINRMGSTFMNPFRLNNPQFFNNESNKQPDINYSTRSLTNHPIPSRVFRTNKPNSKEYHRDRMSNK